jgi:phospholipase D1/2
MDSTMAGKPYKVGRFAHTLRVRLMREHLGIDVDALDDAMVHDSVQTQQGNPDTEQDYGKGEEVSHLQRRRHPVDTVLRGTLDATQQCIWFLLILDIKLSLLL